MNHLLVHVKSANGHLYGFVFVLSSGLRRSRLNWELCFRSQRIPSTLLSPTKKSLRRNQRSFRSEFLFAPLTFPLMFLLPLSFSFPYWWGLQLCMCLLTCLTCSFRPKSLSIQKAPLNACHHSFTYIFFKFQNRAEPTFWNVLFALKGENLRMICFMFSGGNCPHKTVEIISGCLFGVFRWKSFTWNGGNHPPWCLKKDGLMV